MMVDLLVHFVIIATLGCLFSTCRSTTASENDWQTAASRWPRHSGHSKGKLQSLDVICGKDHMTVRAEFDGPFNGIVSSKGTWGQNKCVYIRSHSGVTHATFKVLYNECGTQPDLQGKYYENTIVIQYGTDIIEAMDEAKRLRCEWFEAYEKPATFRPAIPVADLDVVEMNFQGDDIDCWMEIQEGKGPWAREVSRIVPVGQPMTIVIAIQDQSGQFDMRVKSCFAHDGVNPPVQLTDQYGCVLRKSMLSEFKKVKGDEYYSGMARLTGQSSNGGGGGGNGGVQSMTSNSYVHRASILSYAHFFAFKFPDSVSVQIQCTVEVCRNGCPGACERGYFPPPTHILQPKISIHQSGGSSEFNHSPSSSSSSASSASSASNDQTDVENNRDQSNGPYRHSSPLHHHVYVDKENTPVESGDDELSMAAAESSLQPIRMTPNNHLNQATNVESTTTDESHAGMPLMHQLMNLTASVGLHHSSNLPPSIKPETTDSIKESSSSNADDLPESPVYRPDQDDDIPTDSSEIGEEFYATNRPSVEIQPKAAALKQNENVGRSSSASNSRPEESSERVNSEQSDQPDVDMHSPPAPIASALTSDQSAVTSAPSFESSSNMISPPSNSQQVNPQRQPPSSPPPPPPPLTNDQQNLHHPHTAQSVPAHRHPSSNQFGRPPQPLPLSPPSFRPGRPGLSLPQPLAEQLIPNGGNPFSLLNSDAQHLQLLLDNPNALSQLLNNAPPLPLPSSSLINLSMPPMQPNRSPLATNRISSSPPSPPSPPPSSSGTGHKLVATLLKHSPFQSYALNWMQKHRPHLNPSAVFGKGFPAGPRSFRHRRSLKSSPSSSLPSSAISNPIIKDGQEQTTQNKQRKRRSTGSQVYLQKQFQVVTSMDMEFNPIADLEQPALLQGHRQTTSGAGSVCFDFSSAMAMLLAGLGLLSIALMVACCSARSISVYQNK